jgi:pilus assembly protein CpaF
MRPDRIIVGEVRGEEALDMLQAMNTGHDGSLTTVHANSPRDAISRLEVMVTLANANMHLAAIRQQIASAVQILVQAIAHERRHAPRHQHHRNHRNGDRRGDAAGHFRLRKARLSPAGKVMGGSRPPASCRKFNEKLVAAGIRPAGGFVR